MSNTTSGTEKTLIGPDAEIEIHHLNYVAKGNKVLFDGLRFSDNRYVIGQVSLSGGARPGLGSGACSAAC